MGRGRGRHAVRKFRKAVTRKITVTDSKISNTPARCEIEDRHLKEESY